jgi:LL-diaminopimelate aminotransferase
MVALTHQFASARLRTAAAGSQRQHARGLTVQCVAAPEQVTTRVQRNKNMAKLQAGYLFPEIARRRKAHQEKHPDAKIISLGIGDTTEPIPPFIVEAMKASSEGLGTLEGYSGYGAEQGTPALREAICKRLYEKVGRKPNEIFVSDGSKCDIGRLQLMFGADVTVALQDPAYPVYVDSSVIMGMTGGHNGTGFDNIQYMVCRPENDFFPDLSKVPRTDIIFFCSPNNPTGAAATREQLTELVAFAKKNGSIIVYDAAYALYISDDNCPKTIYEIPGAEEVAIETCSFSKYAGFTGVRLGWTVVPEQLRYADGFQVINDFNRIMTTVFNGASNVAQAGGLACLQDDGWKQMLDLVAFYKENAAILRKTFQDMGFTVYGGENAPYVWVGFPGQKSWDVFAEILEKCNIVTTPGSGFGPAGEGFVRASAFGHRENVLEAVERFKAVYSKK